MTGAATVFTLQCVTDQEMPDLKDVMPAWAVWVPVAGSAALGVAVAAQRDWHPLAIATVIVITAMAALDTVTDRIPTFISAVIVIGGVMVLMPFHEPADLAPFYLVVLAALVAAEHEAWVSLTVAAAGAVAFALTAGDEWAHEGVLIWAIGIAFGWMGGASVRAHLRLYGELQVAQADLAERAASDERQRIAREIHDVIAHSLTVTMLHLTGARLALESGDRDEARDALLEAERLGRQSLGDIRRTVGLLGPAASTSPMPSASDLPELVNGYRDAGLDVSYAVDGDPGSLSLATGLGFYRITQEALANAVRHAPGSSARVRLDIGPDEVRLAIANTAPVRVAAGRTAGDADDRPGGMGVDGMRERALLLGGRLSAGPMPEGGWRVEAVVPRHAEQ